MLLNSCLLKSCIYVTVAMFFLHLYVTVLIFRTTRTMSIKEIMNLVTNDDNIVSLTNDDVTTVIDVLTNQSKASATVTSDDEVESYSVMNSEQLIQELTEAPDDAFCTIYVYKDSTKIVRHVGFLLEFKTKTYTLDYGLIPGEGNDKTAGTSICKDVTYDYKTKLVQVDIAITVNFIHFIQVINSILNDYSKTYDALETDKNCRGFVRKHIETINKYFPMSAGDKDTADKFLSEIEKEDIKLIKVATVVIPCFTGLVVGLLGFATSGLQGIASGYAAGRKISKVLARNPKALQYWSSYSSANR